MPAFVYGPGCCVLCQKEYVQLYDHWKKNHAEIKGTNTFFAPMGMVACPGCSKGYNSTHGVRTHQTKANCKAPAAPGTPKTYRTLLKKPAPQSTSSINTAGLQRFLSSPEHQTTPATSIAPRTTSSFFGTTLRTPVDSPLLGKAANPRLREAVEALQVVQQPVLGAEPAPISIQPHLLPSPQLPPPRLPSSPPSPLLTPTDDPFIAPPSAQHAAPQRAALPSAGHPRGPFGRKRDRSPAAPTANTSEDESLYAQPTPKKRNAHPVVRTVADERLTDFHPEDEHLQLLFGYNHIQAFDGRLHPSIRKHFTDAAERVAESFLRAPTEKNLLYWLLLPKAGLTVNLKGKDTNAKHALKQYPDLITPPPPAEAPRLPKSASIGTGGAEENNDTGNILRTQKLVEKGFISRAARAMAEPASLAATSRDTLAALKAKHPSGVYFPFGGAATPRTGPLPSKDDVLEAIQSFPTDTAPGLSGWTIPLLKEATRKPKVAEFLAKLAHLFQTGKLPFMQGLAAARLIPLQKKDGGVRPLAIGDLIYRLLAKVVLKKSCKREMLSPYQFGVQSKGGVEPLIHLIQDAVAGKLGSYNYLWTLDSVNAFNELRRNHIAQGLLQYAPELYLAAKWSYGHTTALATYDGHLVRSAEGVRQGDPLGPFLFSIGIKNTLDALLKDLREAYKDDDVSVLVVAYLDDIYILSQREIPLEYIDKLFENAPIRLNKQKSKCYSFDDIRSTGLDVLGSHIGPLDSRKAFLTSKTARVDALLSRLEQLPHQHALLLLRKSTSTLLRHIPRTLDPDGLRGEWEELDKLMLEAMQRIRGDPTCWPTDADIMALPVREGGMGIQLHAEIAEPAYLASYAAAQLQIQQIGPNLTATKDLDLDRIAGDINTQSSVHKALHAIRNPSDINTGLPEKTPYKQIIEIYNKHRTARLISQLSHDQQRTFQENKAYLGRKWIAAMPTAEATRIADSDMSNMLKIRFLGHPNKQLDICKDCGLDWSYAHDDACKAKHRQTINKHDYLVNTLADGLKQIPGYAVRLEPRGETASERRTDIQIDTPKGRLYWDVTIISLNAKTAANDALSTLTTAEKDKKRKHAALGKDFRPFVISQGGMLSLESAGLYKKLQKAISPSARDWMDTMISIGLARIRGRCWSGYMLDTAPMHNQ